MERGSEMCEAMLDLLFSAEPIPRDVVERMKKENVVTSDPGLSIQCRHQILNEKRSQRGSRPASTKAVSVPRARPNDCYEEAIVQKSILDFKTKIDNNKKKIECYSNVLPTADHCSKNFKYRKSLKVEPGSLFKKIMTDIDEIASSKEVDELLDKKIEEILKTDLKHFNEFERVNTDRAAEVGESIKKTSDTVEFSHSKKESLKNNLREFEPTEKVLKEKIQSIQNCPKDPRCSNKCTTNQTCNGAVKKVNGEGEPSKKEGRDANVELERFIPWKENPPQISKRREIGLGELRGIFKTTIRAVLSKYLMEWRHITRCNKIRRQKTLLFEEKVNSFVERLKSFKEKPVSENDSKGDPKLEGKAPYGASFKCRYKAQKDIICQQKQKLLEQEKLIEELNKKKESVKVVLKIDGASESEVAVKPKLVPPKTPKFLEDMEKRAEERRRRWAEIRELKKKQEEERAERKVMEEEARKRMVEEERKRKEIEMLMKIEAEEDLKRRERERMRELGLKADSHYEKTLTMKAFKGWVKVCEQANGKIEKARELYTSKMKENVFLKWLSYTREACLRRRLLLEKAENKMVLLHAWNSWAKVLNELEERKQVARDYYDDILLKKVFFKWLERSRDTKKKGKWQAIRLQNKIDRVFLIHYFTVWKELPRRMYEERQRERRIRIWQDKVIEIIPDFTME